MMKRLFLSYLFLAHCSALTMSDLQDLMHQNCGLGAPSEDHKELVFFCQLPDEISEDSVQELFNAYTYVEMKDHVFDRMFSDDGVNDIRHSFRVPTASISIGTSELSFVIAREGFPIFLPSKGPPEL